MIKKIVLTGGPGSGKTTVISSIKKHFEGTDFKILVVPETATELINGGIKCFGDNAVSVIDFQELVMTLQLEKEKIYEKAAQELGGNVLIIFDRGTVDNFAYINQTQTKELLKRFDNKINLVNLLERYDLVIDLVSREDFYTTENNQARSENVREALDLGITTLNSWIGHKKLKIVKPKDKIDEKINEVLNHINELLNMKQVKRQEKYLIDLKSSDLLPLLELNKKQSIEQYYLNSEVNKELRIRKTSFSGCVSYYLSEFTIEEDGKKIIERERIISEKEFNDLLQYRDDNYQPIKKNRYYICYDGTYMYLDIFNGDDNYGILEINVDENEFRNVPQYLSVIEKVSSNQRYQNKNIAYTSAKTRKLK